jgi:hypothetical protein
MHTGWLLYQDALDASGYDDDFYWFWFDSKGLKKCGTTKKINGKTYSFDPYGAMEYEWVDTTVGGSSPGWFSAAEDGHLAKSQWIWTDNENLSHDGGDDNHWWYAEKQGNLAVDKVKKINGKWYAFDANGEMEWGFVWLTTPSVKTTGAKPIDFIVDSDGHRVNDPSDIESSVIKSINMDDEKAYLHFFSNDEEKDGSMKTGYNIKIELYDDDFTFGFDKNSGCALNGVDKNKLYYNGILMTADDNRYAAVEVPEKSGKYYLVSSNGTRMKATSRTYKDDSDVYWYVEKGTDKGGFTLWYADSADAAKKHGTGTDKDGNIATEWTGEIVK